MSSFIFFLTPVLVLLVLAFFGFTGCGSFSAEETPEKPTKAPGPPLVVGGPDKPPPPPPVTLTYRDVVTATVGFTALWPLNETGGNIANVVGPLNPAAQGAYYSKQGAPIGSGYKLGQSGVLSPKEAGDFSPEFDGTAAWVEIPFNAPLNPGKMVPGFTLELWIKPNPATTAITQTIISSHRFDSANLQQGYEITLVKDPAQPNHQIHARLFGNIAAPTDAVVQPIGDDPAAWRQVVLIYEIQAAIGPTLTLLVRVAKSMNQYKSGPHSAVYEAVTSAKTSGLRFAAGHAVTSQLPENFFAGQIDNVAFYNTVLPQAEIDKHFNML